MREFLNFDSRFWIAAGGLFFLYFFFKLFKGKDAFASVSDVEKMGLFDGALLALGCIKDKLLGLGDSYSVLCWANSGMGKSESVAVPSILESDDACIIAVDCEGKLAGATMGYRQGMSKVFYFDWTALDNPAKEEIYPRWNPLSKDNLPPRGDARDAYIAILSKNLLSKCESSYWNKLVNLAMEGLFNASIAKIEQAGANDYFLGKIINNKRLSNEDKDILLSYYALMPERYTREAVAAIKEDELNADNYMPIGSWGEIPQAWRGKELCLSMGADFLIQRFLSASEFKDEDCDNWKGMLEGLIKEAKFFGYHKRAIQILEYLFYLTSKQRTIVFNMIMEPLSIFRNQAVRERTSMSDFSNADVKGIQDVFSKEYMPVTIYSSASNSVSKFMTKFFIDMMIDTNINGQGEYPLVFVLDDFENLPRFDALNEGLTRGFSSGVSFLLLTDSLSKLEGTYGVDGLESIVNNSGYKLLAADSKSRLLDNFMRLAQISKSGNFKKIADMVKKSNETNIAGRGNGILLAEGYYNLPIKVNSIYYQHYHELKEKSEIEPDWFFGDVERNTQDAVPPTLEDVLKEVNVYVSSEDDIDEYIEDKYKQAMHQVNTLKDKKSVMAEEISEHWRNVEDEDEEEEIAYEPVAADEWWLKDNSFE